MGNNVSTIMVPDALRSRLVSLQARYERWDPTIGDPPAGAADDAATLDLHCQPINPKMLAVEISRTMAIFPPPQGLDDDGMCALGDAMTEVLRDMPADIVMAALRRVWLECKFFPRPAEVRAFANAELGERKRAAIKAQVAADMAARQKASKPPRPATEAEKARVAEMVASVRVQNRDNPLKAIPGQTPQHVETAEALRLVKAQTAGFRLPAEDDPEVRKWMGAA